jgi:hypothetical protein
VSETRGVMLALFLTASLGCTIGSDYRRADIAGPQLRQRESTPPPRLCLLSLDRQPALAIWCFPQSAPTPSPESVGELG